MGNCVSAPSSRYDYSAPHYPPSQPPMGRHATNFGNNSVPMPNSGGNGNGFIPGIVHRPHNLQLPSPPHQPNGGDQRQNNTPTATTTTTTTSRGAAGTDSGNEAVSRPGLAPGLQQQQQQPGQAGPQHHQDAQQASTCDSADHGAGIDANTEGGGNAVAAPRRIEWVKGRLIGQGAFGSVYKCLVISGEGAGQEIAVKQVSLPRSNEETRGRVSEHVRALESEIALLSGLNHVNIVRYIGTERTDEHINILLEYVPGGSISSKLSQFGPLPEETIKVYTKQILRGLEYLHARKIMHRDIKGANILTDSSGIVKLADFGASKSIEDVATIGSGAKSIKGTPFWMAPEVIKQTGHGRPADIWSLGCVVIEMATGKPPWSNCGTAVAALFQIASSRDPPPLPDNISPVARDFLLLCFNRVPKERPNATRLLKHPWLVNVPIPTAPQAPALPRMQQPGMTPPTGIPSPLPGGTGTAHTPLMNGLPLLNMSVVPGGLNRSPPSPIKEESESRFDSPGGNGAMGTPSRRAAPGTASVNSKPTEVYPAQQQQQRPAVPPLPIAAMKLGILPPTGTVKQQQPAVQQPPNAPAQQPTLVPPRPASASTYKQPHLQPTNPMGQVAPQQYDTVVSPPPGFDVMMQQAKRQQAQPQQQQAEAASRTYAQAQQQAGAPQAPQPAQQQQQHQEFNMPTFNPHASTMTLDFNPMEEPSWMPALRPQVAAGPMEDSPRGGPRDQEVQAQAQQAEAAARPHFPTVPEEDEADHEPELDQPPPPSVTLQPPAGFLLGKAAAAAFTSPSKLARSSSNASARALHTAPAGPAGLSTTRKALEEAGLLVHQHSGGVASSTTDASGSHAQEGSGGGASTSSAASGAGPSLMNHKHKQWRDELDRELNEGREKLRAQRESALFTQQAMAAPAPLSHRGPTPPHPQLMTTPAGLLSAMQAGAAAAPSAAPQQQQHQPILVVAPQPVPYVMNMRPSVADL